MVATLVGLWIYGQYSIITTYAMTFHDSLIRSLHMYSLRTKVVLNQRIYFETGGVYAYIYVSPLLGDMLLVNL